MSYPSTLWGPTFRYLSQTGITCQKIATAIGFTRRLVEPPESRGDEYFALRRADESYHRALRSLRQCIASQASKDVAIPALGSILLVILSSSRAAHSETIFHLRSGMGIVREAQTARKSSNDSKEIEVLLRYFCVITWLASLTHLPDDQLENYAQLVEIDQTLQRELGLFETAPSEPPHAIDGGTKDTQELDRSRSSPDEASGRVASLRQLRRQQQLVCDFLHSAEGQRQKAPVSYPALKAACYVLGNRLKAVLESDKDGITVS